MSPLLARRAWLVAAVLGAACGSSDELSGAPLDDPAPTTVPLQAAARQRPEGWDEASHGDAVRGDYAHLFPSDRVPRIDLTLTKEDAALIITDLEQRIGKPGGKLEDSAVTADCQGKLAGAACSLLGLTGTCAVNAFPPVRNAPLQCKTADQEDQLDLIAGDPIPVSSTVHFEGKTWQHVSFRFKGNSSLSVPFRAGVRKLGFRLDFDKLEDTHPEIKNQRFHGFGELTFTPGFSDASLIREKLAADLLRDMGAVAAHAAFYRLYVDSGAGPEYWGLYTMVEDPADRLPDLQFADGRGNLYKPDGVGADFTRLEKKSFEKKTNAREGDYSDVARAIAALHAPRTDAEAWRRGLEATFDVEAFLKFLAFSRASDNWDAYGANPHNYYLYGDPSQGGRLVWISWDHNITWTGFSSFLRMPNNVMMDQVSARWPLIRFLLDDPVYRARYRQLLTELLEGVYEKGRFDARVSALHALIAPYVVGEQGEKAPYTLLRSASSFQSALPALISAADERRKAIVEALQPPAPVASEPPVASAPPVGIPATATDAAPQ